jgi:hypothetical protein
MGVATMIDPMFEFLNGTKRPVILVYSTPYSPKAVETLVEPSEPFVVYDQRSKVTAMVRDLTDAEMAAYLKAKEEKAEEEKKHGK